MTRGSRAFLCGVTLVAGALALGACDNDGRSVSSGRPSASSSPASQGAGQSADYVGLTKQAAIAKAEAAGRPWRIGREDAEQFMLTQDFVRNRVTFEIDNGKVTKATFG